MRLAVSLLGVLAACGSRAVDPPREQASAPPKTAAAQSADSDVYQLLDAVGVIASDKFDPVPVIAAVNALQPMGRQRGTETLAAYFEARGSAVSERGGLFAVVQVLYQGPQSKPPFPQDACTPRQTDFVSGPCVRAPRLGAPQPPPPDDLRSLHFPFFVLGDVPLSLIIGYALGGEPEPISDYASALAAAPTTWLKAPLKPSSPGEIRYLFMHYGQWGVRDPVTTNVETQLNRLTAGGAASER